MFLEKMASFLIKLNVLEKMASFHIKLNVLAKMASLVGTEDPSPWAQFPGIPIIGNICQRSVRILTGYNCLFKLIHIIYKRLCEKFCLNVIQKCDYHNKARFSLTLINLAFREEKKIVRNNMFAVIYYWNILISLVCLLNQWHILASLKMHTNYGT